uniref:ShKT domain-containing protein n=1 Tax=Steinernema glaseri TaxID=37863 RepID=A0A1I7ZLM0_9BILA
MLSYYTIFILCFSACSALVCITCYGDSCADANKWVKENCPPDVTTCYTFRNEHNKVYKRGCATEKCENRKRLCSECDSDNCNGRRSNPLANYHGGGGLWDKSTAGLSTRVAVPLAAALTLTVYALI